MSLLGNLIWLICGGLFSAAAWFFIGLLWSITIIGLPVGLQCFKMARLSLSPFGKIVDSGGSTGSLLLNILWLLLGGIELAIFHFIIGVILCVTIIGIPFGRQFFKFAQLALFPFGATIHRSSQVYRSIN
ncbi:YccF domain-containing protein [Fundicoccus ignavus]|uniref:YccF domain-containing protein n=1 Tax=Fundicoccus ignavus TaxID=2664442 RepID=A0A844C6T5_9LACT|nr:YccF domain-containing protein [Fundicoccus ignavus]MRJ46207.1 YccF domain-containing protein [Fundicoccus ignavus]